MEHEGQRSQQGWAVSIGATKQTAIRSPLALCPRDSAAPEPLGDLPTGDGDF